MLWMYFHLAFLFQLLYFDLLGKLWSNANIKIQIKYLITECFIFQVMQNVFQDAAIPHWIVDLLKKKFQIHKLLFSYVI